MRHRVRPLVCGIVLSLPVLALLACGGEMPDSTEVSTPAAAVAATPESSIRVAVGPTTVPQPQAVADHRPSPEPTAAPAPTPAPEPAAVR